MVKKDTNKTTPIPPHNISPDVLAQMEKNVAETGSTTRKYKVQVEMPAITFGWILVDALNEEEAYKLVEEKLNIEGVEAVNDWQEELYYFNENITITTDSIEEYNELE